MVGMLNSAQLSWPWTINASINDGYPLLVNLPMDVPQLEGGAVDLSVHPTLIEDNVQIDAANGLTDYSSFTATGKLVRIGKLNGTTALLDLRELGIAAYVLAVRTEKGAATQRIVKQ